MTPKDIVNFVSTYDFNFSCFDDVDWKLNEIEELDEEGKELFKKIGEYEQVDEYNDVKDEKRRTDSIILHFISLGFYIEEKTYFVWGEENGREYFVVEPVGQKVIYGNPKLISE